MNVLFINAAFREDSRTDRLAKAFLETCEGTIKTIDLGKCDVDALRADTLKVYNDSVSTHKFEHRMFDYAKEFVEADEIVIAAPFWNFTLPAVLHAYLELVCSQGISFDITEKGEYVSLCKAKKITFLTTAGGYIPEEDHAFGYIKTCAEFFWHIPTIQCFKVEGLDIYGTDVEVELEKVMKQF